MTPTLSKSCILVVTTLCLINESYSKKHDKPFDRSMINFQTGIDFGSTFAGGMVYDKVQNRLFLTGGTYARGFFLPESSPLQMKEKINSDCFFTTIQLVNSTSDEMDVAQWKQPIRLGYVKDIEACSTAHYLTEHSRVFLGASASGQSFGKTDAQGDNLPQSRDVTLFGEVISLSLDHVYNIAPIIPQHYIFGGHGFFNAEVSYPFAITSLTEFVNSTKNATSADVHEDRYDEEEPKPTEAIYVASLYSKYGGQWNKYLNATEIDIASPFVEGNVWGIAIQKIKVSQSNATDEYSLLADVPHMERVWSKNIETSNFQKLQAIGMIYVNDILLLAGSTYDIGPQFAGEERTYKSKQDYDGFLTKIDPSTGEMKTSNGTDEKMKVRIQSDFEVDDIVHGICLHPKNNVTGNVPFVYVVGSTENELDIYGNITGGGFIMQIDLYTMEVIWEDKIPGLDIDATDCVVTADGQWVYVIGHARNNAALHGWTSNGGDDIWIRQYGAISGQPRWEEQIGSNKDESLAKGGAIVLDNRNNAIIYGNTRGSIGRVRSLGLEIPDTTNDIFVMTVDFHGAYLAPDPNTIFQIPRFYLDERNGSHFAFISCMVVITIVILAVVLGTEATWKPINSAQVLRTSNIYPISSSRREERKSLRNQKKASTEMTENEDASFVLFQSERGSTKRSDMALPFTVRVD